MLSQLGRTVSRISSIVILATCLFGNIITAQQLLDFSPNALPACAQQCQLLAQAQAACVPPAAPATSQQTYLSCFCQSAYLVALRTDATTVCGNVCQGADLPLIQQWYTNTCAAAANNQAPQTTVTATQTTEIAATAAGPTTNGATTQAGQTGTSRPQPSDQSWWAGHWKWVLMIILILVLLGLFALIAVWLRRRHRRKGDQATGRFNDGITTRSMTANPNALVGFPYPGTRDGRRTTSALGTHSDSDSRLASAANLFRIRERGRGDAQLAADPSAQGEDMQNSRGGAMLAEAPASSRNGKSRARINEDEVRT